MNSWGVRGGEATLWASVVARESLLQGSSCGARWSASHLPAFPITPLAEDPPNQSRLQPCQVGLQGSLTKASAWHGRGFSAILPGKLHRDVAGRCLEKRGSPAAWAVAVSESRASQGHGRPRVPLQATPSRCFQGCAHCRAFLSPRLHLFKMSRKGVLGEVYF